MLLWALLLGCKCLLGRGAASSFWGAHTSLSATLLPGQNQTMRMCPHLAVRLQTATGVKLQQQRLHKLRA